MPAGEYLNVWVDVVNKLLSTALSCKQVSKGELFCDSFPNQLRAFAAVAGSAWHHELCLAFVRLLNSNPSVEHATTVLQFIGVSPVLISR